MRLGIEAPRDFDVETLFKMPPLVPPKATSIDELAANEQPLKSTADLEAQKVEVKALEQALALQPLSSRSHASISALLVEQQSVLDRLLKKAPGALVQIEKLRSARQAQRMQFTQLHERAETGKANAAKYVADLLAEFDGHIAAITERRKEVVSAYEKADKAWDGFNAARRAQWDQLLAQFDAKIHELEVAPAIEAMQVDASQVPRPVAAQHAPDAPAAVPEVAQPLALVDPLVQAQQDGAATQQALVAAQAAQRQAMIAAAAIPPHLQTFACDLSEIPDSLPAPSDEQWAQLHQLWVALETLNRHEGVTGNAIPITFNGLAVSIEMPKLLLGETLWKRAFPNGEPSGDAIVTWQLRCILKESMQKHQAQLVADHAAHAAAEAQTSPSIVASVRDYRAKRHCPGINPEAASSGA